jgi:hypothetical protein
MDGFSMVRHQPDATQARFGWRPVSGGKIAKGVGERIL